MDEALIKPQRVRRVVRLQAPADSSIQADVSAQGTLVEVADPRALRPRDFRADFLYRPESSAEDIALCELPPLLESVLGGTDAVLLVGGPAGGAQAELLDGDGGLYTRAVAQLAMELQARQARHRSGGSGGYSFYLKLQAFQVVGDRIEDLLTDQPEPSRLTDTDQGVFVEGLRGVSISAAEEAARLLEVARRRQDPAQRPKRITAVLVEVTQADYFAGWGLFGRLLIVEPPALDCLAEDRGLVQLREGFDTFRGIFHLRALVQNWQPRMAGDVNGSVLTWLLREVLCGGSCAATVLFCLRQQQPSVSTALMEFMDAFTKVETNPVCCDHRVAGLLFALRAQILQARSVSAPGGALLGGAGGVGSLGGDRSGDEDARRIILELEKRLRVAERGRDDAVHGEEVKQGRVADFQERYVAAVRGQEAMHERLVTTEEEHLRACEGLVQAQLEHAEAKEELGELKVKDNILLMVLEQEVADLQTEASDRLSHVERLEEARASEEVQEVSEGARELAEARRRVGDLQASLDAATEARIHADVQREVQCGRMENQVEALRNELQKGALEGARQRDEDLRAAGVRAEEPARELQAVRRAASELREELKAESAAGARAREAGDATSAELANLRQEFHTSLARLAAAPSSPAAGGAGADAASATVPPGSVGSNVGAAGGGGAGAARFGLDAELRAGREREQALREERARLDAQVLELELGLAWSSAVALDWAPEAGADADKARLRSIADEAAAKAAVSSRAGSGRERELQHRHEAMTTELEAERQRGALARAEHAQELRRLEVERKRLDAEVLGLRAGVGGAGLSDSQGLSGSGGLASIQQQLLSEVESLRFFRGGSGAGGAGGRGVGGGGADADILEQNRSLRAKVEALERQLPGDQRVQMQRLAFLEKSSRSLEAERSELLVRATVAEEQLTQLQRHLKEITESYQMQVLQLKLQAKAL